MLFISLLVYMPLGIYCSSVSEDSSTSLTHPWNSIRRSLAATSTPIVPPIPRKDLPVGSDFKRIITENRIYVDKTDIIHRMITKEVYVFLSRPPRFGKSLLVSTLSHLFNGSEKLFEGTKIKETFGYKFPNYTVLHFDFINLRSESLSTFNESMHEIVGDFLIEYGINEQGCDPKQGVKRCLHVLLQTLNKRTGKKNVVLVDEYDDPWRNFGGDEKDRQAMLSITRDFFKIFKSNDNNIQFCFVTGSTKIALTEFFSGYNCATDISWLPYFETIVGFSQSELKMYFSGYVKDRATRIGTSVEKVYQQLDEAFEGYRFSQQDENMYNSRDIIDFFKNYEYGAVSIDTYQKQTDLKYVMEVIRKMPELTIGLDLLTQLNTNQDVRIPVDEDFIRGFKESFTSPKATLKVLYEGGYLSIKYHNSMGPHKQYYIGFTNKAVQRHYCEILKKAFDEQAWYHLYSIISEHDPGFREPLEQRDITSFLKRVRTHFTRVPYLLLPEKEKLVESFFQLMLYYGMILSGMRTNWETILATGRLDVRATSPGTSFIFELKRKSNREWKKTMKQCNDYTHQECFRNRRVVCIGIIFEDEPAESKRVIHAWGMFEKSSDGLFLPERNSMDMTEYEAEGEPERTTTAPKKVETKCDRCAKDFSNGTVFIEHLKETHNLDHGFIKTNLVCPHCWKPFGNQGGLSKHITRKHPKLLVKLG